MAKRRTRGSPSDKRTKTTTRTKNNDVATSDNGVDFGNEIEAEDTETRTTTEKSGSTRAAKRTKSDDGATLDDTETVKTNVKRGRRTRNTNPGKRNDVAPSDGDLDAVDTDAAKTIRRRSVNTRSAKRKKSNDAATSEGDLDAEDDNEATKTTKKSGETKATKRMKSNKDAASNNEIDADDTENTKKSTKKKGGAGKKVGKVPFPILSKGDRFVTCFGVVEVIADDRAPADHGRTVVHYPLSKTVLNKVCREKEKRQDKKNRIFVQAHTHLSKSRKAWRKKLRHLYGDNVPSTEDGATSKTMELSGEDRVLRLRNELPVELIVPTTTAGKFVSRRTATTTLVKNVTAKAVTEDVVEDPREPPDSYPDRMVECFFVADERRRVTYEFETTRSGYRWTETTAETKRDEETAPRPFLTHQNKLFLKRSLLVNRYDPDDRIMTCDTCGKTFISMSGYKLHVERKVCLSKPRPVPIWISPTRRKKKRDYRAERIRREQRQAAEQTALPASSANDDGASNVVVVFEGGKVPASSEQNTVSPERKDDRPPTYYEKQVEKHLKAIAPHLYPEIDISVTENVFSKKNPVAESMYPNVWNCLGYRCSGKRTVSWRTLTMRKRSPWLVFDERHSSIYPAVYRALEFRTEPTRKREKKEGRTSNASIATATKTTTTTPTTMTTTSSASASVAEKDNGGVAAAVAARKRSRIKAYPGREKLVCKTGRLRARKRTAEELLRDAARWEKEKAERQKKLLGPVVDVQVVVEEVDQGRYPSMKRFHGSHASRCFVCDETSGVLRRCAFCQNACHLECLKERVSVRNPAPGDDFMCHPCLKRVLARRIRAEKRRLAKRDDALARAGVRPPPPDDDDHVDVATAEAVADDALVVGSLAAPCPVGGPGGLVCCGICTARYSQAMADVTHEMEIQSISIMGREVSEMYQLLQDAHARLREVIETSEENEERRALFEDEVEDYEENGIGPKRFAVS